MRLTLLSCLFFLLPFFNLSAQILPSDSVEYITEEVDTVIIMEEPVVYIQSLIIEEVQPVKWYLSASASLFTTLDYYSPCEQCEYFLKQYQTAVSSTLSYSYGAELTYVPGKLLFSVASDYTEIKEKFSYSSNGVDYSDYNSIRLADVRATSGYWFRRNKKNISFIVNAGLVYHRLLSTSGEVNSFRDSSNAVVSISDAGKFRNNQYSFTLSVKTILRPDKRIKVFIEPYYMGNLLSVTKDYYPYAQYFNRLGARLGILFSL